MKSMEEIKKTPRVQLLLEESDGGWALVHLSNSRKPYPAKVVFSWSGGWDHVSVSFRGHCPSWEEMCEVKRLFFHPEEICVQFHPAESEYVNTHPYCLHLWRSQQEKMPVPPSWMVGVKDGQTLSAVYRTALESLRAMEEGTHES